MKAEKPKKIRIWMVLVSIFLFIFLITAIDFYRISNYETYPKSPNLKIQLNESQVYHDLVNGKSITDWNRLDGTLSYIKAEYDCSDFRLVNLIRILYEFNDSIPTTYKSKIEDVLMNFRYWMDEPGENSMCYWSENHQILFASAEYLIGQKYPNEIFHNSGLTGEQHYEKARQRILDWLQMRWDYGFTEFYSNVYYKEDIGAIINLIDYAEDEEIVKKSKIIMDLLFYDVAAQNCDKLFVSTSGRAYESHRKKGSMSSITNYYWGDGRRLGPGMVYGLEATKNYQLPPVLKEIALDSNNVVIKQRNGLNLEELGPEGFSLGDTKGMMMQWGMEAFTNPEVIRNSLAYIRNNSMFSNVFVTDFKMLDFSLLKWLHLEPEIVELINPQYNGIAIQKGNTYTYKTKDYSIYTAQRHQVGDFADQQHIFGVNVKGHFAVFHCHPAIDKGKNQSPNYWVGYGHFPHAVQDKNVNLSIYSLPAEKGIIEMDLLDYTHAYFPKNQFDTLVMDKNYVFGKKGETYVAFVGANEFYYKNDSDDDIIQEGKKAFWITEASSQREDGSFQDFIRRIKDNKVSFNKENMHLSYLSKGRQYALSFDGDFKIDDKIIDTNYKRFDSPYIQAEKKADKLKFELNGKTLLLDFKNQIREF